MQEAPATTTIVNDTNSVGTSHTDTLTDTHWHTHIHTYTCTYSTQSCGAFTSTDTLHATLRRPLVVCNMSLPEGEDTIQVWVQDTQHRSIWIWIWIYICIYICTYACLHVCKYICRCKLTQLTHAGVGSRCLYRVMPHPSCEMWRG